MKQAEGQSFGRLAKIANFILTVSGILCLMAFFYFIYDYVWMGHRYLATPAGILLHYALPAILAAGFFRSLRLDPLKRINLSLVMISIGASIYATNLLLVLYDRKIEAATRTLQGNSEYDVTDIVKLAKQYGVDYDSRGKLEVIDDLRKKGISAVPVVAPVNVLKEQPEDGSRRSAIKLNGIEVLPAGGISNATTVYCNEMGQYVIYQSDEHGFHNPRGLWNSTRIDIMAVGDSFTQGACVPSGKNLVALIREHFPNTLNLGMGGNGPLAELATLKEYLEVLKPKIVLWFFFEGNDIWDLHRERKSPLLMRYLTGKFKQFLFNRQSEIDQALLSFLDEEKARFNFAFPVKPKQMTETISQASSFLKEGLKLTHLRRRLDLSLGYIDGDSYQSNAKAEAAMALLPNVLSEAKASADARGTKLYFVFLPQRERYSDATFANETRHQVLSVVKGLGIPLIDVHAEFKKHKDPLDFFPFRRVFHYNENGYQVVSHVVLRHISQ
jgi:hypothetical protein